VLSSVLFSLSGSWFLVLFRGGVFNRDCSSGGAVFLGSIEEFAGV